MGRGSKLGPAPLLLHPGIRQPLMNKLAGGRDFGRGGSSVDGGRVGSPDHLPLQSDFGGSEGRGF